MDKIVNCEKYSDYCTSCKYFCSHTGCNGRSCKDCDNGPYCKCLDDASNAETCPYYKEER